MGQHTPGPWRSFINDSGDEWSGWPLAITAPSVHEDCVVVRTGGQWPYDWDYQVSRAEAVANAHLIAAAPELLEALREAHSLILAPAEDIKADVLSRIRSALAKAGGL